METMIHIYKHTVLLRNKYSRRIKWHTNCAEIVLALNYRRVVFSLINYIYIYIYTHTTQNIPATVCPRTVCHIPSPKTRRCIAASVLDTDRTRSIE